MESTFETVSPIFMQIIGVVLMLGLTVSVLLAVAAGIRALVKITKRDSKKAKYILLIVVTVVLMFLSWIFNLGWYRVFLTWIPIPIFHTVAFVATNIILITRQNDSYISNKLVLASCATFLLTYLLFPDGGDIGPMYAFFGTIKGDAVGYLIYASIVFLVLNLISLVFELVKISDLKKSKKSNEKKQ